MKSTLSPVPPFALLPTGTPLPAVRSTAAAWIRGLLVFAAAWNLIGGTSALLDPAKQFAQLFNTSLDLTDPLALFFYRCTWINVTAWGVGYLLAVFLPTAHVPVLAAGGTGKICYFAACWAAFASGAAKPALLAAGIVDVAFAGLFLWVILSPRPNRTPTP